MCHIICMECHLWNMSCMEYVKYALYIICHMCNMSFMEYFICGINLVWNMSRGICHAWSISYVE